MYTTMQGTKLNEQEYKILKKMYNRYCLLHIFEQGYDFADIIDATKEAVMMNWQMSDDLFKSFLDYFELICFDEWLESDFPNYNTRYLKELFDCVGWSDEEKIKIAIRVQERI